MAAFVDVLLQRYANTQFDNCPFEVFVLGGLSPKKSGLYLEYTFYCYSCDFIIYIYICFSKKRNAFYYNCVDKLPWNII